VTTVWSVVVAAGSGTRFGARKQYETLGDRRVLDWALDAARSVAGGVVAVVPAAHAAGSEPGADVLVAGGETRSASVRAGLAVVPEAADVIVVHDAARPLAGVELFRAVIGAVRDGADGAVPLAEIGLPLKRVDDVRVTATVDRMGLVAVQTPQAFRAAPLLEAYRAAERDGFVGTDTASCVERFTDLQIGCVPCPATNLKITFPEDVAVAERLLVDALGR